MKKWFTACLHRRKNPRKKLQTTVTDKNLLDPPDFVVIDALNAHYQQGRAFFGHIRSCFGDFNSSYTDALQTALFLCRLEEDTDFKGSALVTGLCMGPQNFFVNGMVDGNRPE